jgi:hypothetical protein
MMDVAFEPKRADNWKLWTPLALYFGLFGYFHATDSGVMVVFRKRDVARERRDAPAL